MSSLRIDKFAPDRVHPDEPFTYEVRVTNTSLTPVDVMLAESLLSSLEIVSADPPPQAREPHAGRWVLGPIYPGGSRGVVLHCRAHTPMSFRSHTQLSFSQEG